MKQERCLGTKTKSSYLVFFSACPTTGTGNGNVEGNPCVFPFTYEGITYTQYCSSVDEPAPWCYTVPNGIAGDPYGFCNNCGMQNGKACLPLVCILETLAKGALPCLCACFSWLFSDEIDG